MFCYELPVLNENMARIVSKNQIILMFDILYVYAGIFWLVQSFTKANPFTSLLIHRLAHLIHLLVPPQPERLVMRKTGGGGGVGQPKMCIPPGKILGTPLPTGIDSVSQLI